MLRRRIILSLLLCALSAHGEAPPSPKVLERYKQMLEKNPVEGTALDRLWKAYSDAGETATLLDEYRRGDFAAEMVLGLLSRKAGREEDAAAAFERAAKIQPDSPAPLLALARLRSDQSRPRDAAILFEKAASILPPDDPRHPETLMQLGAAWLAAGEVERAAEAWERTIARDPMNLELRRRLAESYARHHLADRAIAHLAHLRDHAPPADRAQALQQLARIHQGAGRQDEAIRALEQALAGLAPGNWMRGEVQSQLIRLHQRFHRTAELEERWKKAAADNPRDAGALLQLIDLYERLGDLEQQCAWIQKLATLLPKSIEHRLRLARVHAQLDELDRAAAIYDQLLKEQPGSADLVFERARIDIQREAPKAARERIAALLVLRRDEDSIRSKALEFYETHRLTDLVEQHLVADATGGAEESLFALASFYFSEKRAVDGRRVVERVIRPADSPERRAAAQARIAQFLKDQHDFDGAADAIAAAIGVEPRSREYRMLQGDIDLARSQYPGALAAFEKVFELSSTPAQVLEADQKIFECIRSGADKPSVTAARDMSVTPPPGFIVGTGPSVALAATNPQLEDYLLKLTRAAVERRTVDGWLRIARWQLWNRSFRIAQECARHALALDPNSIAAREFLVNLAAAESQPHVAVEQLRELMESNPGARSEYLRRAGQLEIQGGRVDEALRIFSELAAANPGSTEALSDLALTQQRAEQWKEALETWLKIHAITPAPRRKEVNAALLRVYERLEMPREAAALLLRQIDAQGDEKEQLALFQELLAHCNKHRLLDWLRGEFEARRKIRTDDYFTGIALGRILKATGDRARAFELLADASFAAPNQAEALPELIREAEELRRLDAAVRLQAQLVRIVPQSYPAAFEKLAQLQEKNFDIDEAARTWERIVAKFPRHAGALQHAVDFQLKWGSPSRAAELLRKLRALDPGNVRALAVLAQLDLEAGANAEAQACLEDLLRHSPPEKPGDAIRFPSIKPEDSGRLHNTYLSTVQLRQGRPTAEAWRDLRSFWVPEQSALKNESDLRLGAIRDLARLVAAQGDARQLAAWTERWKKAAAQAPGEVLWALHFAGATEALLDHVETLASRKGMEATAKQAFIWFALDGGAIDRLAAWIQDQRRTPLERDYLLVALGQHIEKRGGRLETGLVERLFPQSFRLRLWQAAALLASRGHFREATQLGQRVFDVLSTQRAAFGVELAHWHLHLGDVEAARRALRESIRMPGESFEAPVFAALREYFFLLPEDQRAAFAETFLRSIDRQKQPLHAALCGALLRGLMGDGMAARGELTRVLELRAMSHLGIDQLGNSASRHWDYVLNAGAQLQAWKLDGLAIFLWEKALADSAFIRLQAQAQGEQVQARSFDIRARLAALKVARAAPVEAQDLIEEFARRSPQDGLIPLAEALESIGAHPRAIAVFRQVWEREPTNPHALRNLLSACRTGSDFEAMEQVLTRCVRDGLYRANDAAHRDLAFQLTDLLEKRGDIAQARFVLEHTLEHAPHDSRLLLRLGQVHERAKRPDLAEAIYRRLLSIESGNLAARLALAAMLDSQQQYAAALQVLEKTTGPEAEAKLAQLHLKLGHFDDAVASLDRVAPPMHVSATLLFANTLAERKELRAARSVLRNALGRMPEARTNFPLQSRIIELLAPDEDPAMIARELRRLRQMAGEETDLLGGYFDLLLREAPRLGMERDMVRELQDDWAAGKGLAAAGAALLEWQLLCAADARKRVSPDGRSPMQNESDALCAKLLAREDVPEAVVRRIAASLQRHDRADLAVQAQGRLARLAPLDFSRMIDWARALHGLGRGSEAFAVLDELGWRGVLSDEIAGRVAQTFAELGARDRARAAFAQAVKADPVARQYRTYLDYARLLVAERDFPGAKRLLRTAFRNPSNSECGEIVAVLAAAERLDRFDAEVAELGLDRDRLIAARRALFSHREKAGELAKATALVDEHPEIVNSSICARLRAMAAAAGAFDQVAVLFERLRGQSGETFAIDGELAALYADAAEADLRGLQTDAAIARLRRGHELRPEHFGIAQRLSGLQLERGDRKLAAQTLEEFLAASRDPSEKEKARQLLARVKR